MAVRLLYFLDVFAVLFVAQSDGRCEHFDVLSALLVDQLQRFLKFQQIRGEVSESWGLWQRAYLVFYLTDLIL